MGSRIHVEGHSWHITGRVKRQRKFWAEDIIVGWGHHKITFKAEKGEAPVELRDWEEGEERKKAAVGVCLMTSWHPVIFYSCLLRLGRTQRLLLTYSGHFGALAVLFWGNGGITQTALGLDNQHLESSSGLKFSLAFRPGTPTAGQYTCRSHCSQTHWDQSHHKVTEFQVLER